MSNSSTDFMNRAMALLDKDNAETQKNQELNLLMLRIAARDIRHEFGVDMKASIHKYPGKGINDIRLINLRFFDERKNDIVISFEIVDSAEIIVSNEDDFKDIIGGMLRKTNIESRMCTTVDVYGNKLKLTTKQPHDDYGMFDKDMIKDDHFVTRLDKDKVAFYTARVLFSLFVDGVLREDITEQLEEELKKREAISKKIKELNESKSVDGRKARELTEKEKESMKERREYIASITHEYKR